MDPLPPTDPAGVSMDALEDTLESLPVAPNALKMIIPMINRAISTTFIAFFIYMNAIKILHDLIHLRGYTRVENTDQLYIAFDPKQQTYIQFFICHQEKLDMSYFYKAYEQLRPGISHLIFIYTLATIQIKKLKMYKDILKIEFFNENELRRLLTGNRLIPAHSQVPDDEREQILKKFGRDNLPMILQTDPIVKLYDFDLDSVIQITRPDAMYYRLVVADDS